MRARAQQLCTLLSALALLVGACDGGDGETATTATTATATSEGADNPEPHVSFTGYVDLLDLCGAIGSTHVFLRASRVGCIGSPPAPCTLPTDPYMSWVGDAAACPNASTANLMRVDVPEPGKFQVEAITLTETGELSVCLGQDGADVVQATAEEIEARTDIAVEVLSGPCSAP